LFGYIHEKNILKKKPKITQKRKKEKKSHFQDLFFFNNDHISTYRIVPLEVDPQNPRPLPLLHPFSPKNAGTLTSGGKRPTTHVQGCNLKCAPTFPPLKIFERSIMAGV
jgi:hypothetical protein